MYGSLLERFEDKYVPEPNSGCWLWTAALSKGYGNIWVSGDIYRGAHVVAYELFIGPVPEGKELDHKCRTKPCVNPYHLEPVTHLENTRRAGVFGGAARNKAKTHCKRGHPFDEANTYRSSGKRGCRTCQLDWHAQHDQRKGDAA